jgi:drug/metabolite transporter (DMT)-like permease
MRKLSRPIIIGALITLSGSMLYVLLGVLAKIINQHLLLNDILFLQSISGFCCAALFMRIQKYKWQSLWKNFQLIYFARIVMSLASIYALIYGLKYVSVYNALVILNLSPLVIPILRRVFLKKKMNVWVFPAVLLAFTGIVLILAPDSHLIQAPTAMILLSMLCMSLSLLLLETAPNTDPNLSIFYYFLFSTLIVSTVLVFQPSLLLLNFKDVFLGVLSGVLFFFVQCSVIYAAKYISSQLISVLFYAEIIFAMLASVMLENLQLDAYLILGTILVMTGGLAVLFIEN